MLPRCLVVPICALPLSACLHLQAPPAQGIPSAAAYQPAPRVLSSADACRDALVRSAAGGDFALDPTGIALLSWNIKKGAMPDWRRDLRTLAADKHLVLIQEATWTMQDAPFLPLHWAFAPGYRSSTQLSGVATISTAAPGVRCQFQNPEPWLRTPKATKITRYALEGTGQSLVVVNIHMVNFSFGVSEFQAQLGRLLEVVSAHDGPLIVSGDFNTWNRTRQRILADHMASLGARPVSFSQDLRSRFRGEIVDHVFVAGLSVRNAVTHAVDSSDHNAISLQLSL